MPSGLLPRFEAAGKFTHNNFVKLVAQVQIFNAGIDIGVVVHFNDKGLVTTLLHVNAIEPVANGLGSFQSGLNHMFWHFEGG